MQNIKNNIIDASGVRQAGAIKWMRTMLVVIAVLAIILTLIPWYAEYLKNESLKQAESGNNSQALHTAGRAVMLEPMSVGALFVLAGAQQRLGRESAARDTLTEATRQQPLNYATWEQLATYERNRWGQPELANEHFAKAISLNPYDRQLREKAGM
ncbi:MAG: hypothetical protein ACYC6B_02770 [Thermoleophilia bacterium]